MSRQYVHDHSRELRVQTGGDGGPPLLLLHGLGATSDVWSGWTDLLAERWPGRWIAPDLPGHGQSDLAERYSFGALASSVAPLVHRSERVFVIGHSLGGVIGLALASGWFGVTVDTIVGLGIKVAWTDDGLTRAASLASRPVQTYGTRAEAIDRHLKVSGLAGLVDPGDPGLAHGVRGDADEWWLTLDNRAFGVGAPDMRGLLAASRARVVLARGELDPMNSDEQLAELVPDAVTLAGLGHNAHVEDPSQVLALVGLPG